MSMKQAGGNRKPGGGGSGAAAASGPGGGGGTGGRQNLGSDSMCASIQSSSCPDGIILEGGHMEGRNSIKGPSSITFNGVYANMRMVHILTSVVGTKCELKVKNGVVYEGVFKTYGPECDLVLDAAHRRCLEQGMGPRREDIVESIIFKASDVVVVQFRDVDLNYARKDNFTDAAVSARLNGEHKEKDLEPWDGGDQHGSDSLESLDTDVSNGWDPNEMFKFNEETYGVKSTYDSSMSSYTVPLERDDSEEFLKREARATQLAEEIESSTSYRARMALENDARTEEEKYTAVVRSERDTHSLGSRENKYIPPGQRNKEGMSWGTGRQNSPRLVQSSPSVPSSRPGPHDYSPSSGTDQRVVNGGAPWPSPCPSPSFRPPSRYPSGPTSLPPRAATPTRPPSRAPSRPSRPPSHPSAHGSPAPVSTAPKRMSTEGPPRMSPKTQRTPRTHRVPSARGGMPPGPEFMAHSGDTSTTPPTRSSPSGGTWSSVVSGAHRPRSPRQNGLGSAPGGSSPQAGTTPVDPVATPVSAMSPTAASPASNRAATPLAEAKESRVQEARTASPVANKENVKPAEASPGLGRALGKGPPTMASDHRKQIDNLKEFSVVFRLQSSSTPDPVFDQMMSKPREQGEKPKELPPDRGAEPCGTMAPEPPSEEKAPGPAPTTGGATGSKPSSPGASGPCIAAEQKRGPDVTSQAVQTSGPSSKLDGKEDKDDKKDPVPEQVRKSTLNPNAKEFNPRAFCPPPKPATTPTPPRPQGQPSPSIVVPQPPTVYSQTVCFPQMYPLTPVSPGVQPPAMYHVPVPHMTVSQTKPYRAGKVPSMPQQRPDQHHPQGTPTMMHPATAAGPPIVAPSPAYSAQYFTCSPQQFTSQPLVQQMPHYQSQAQHVFSPVMQGSARMMAPPAHGQPSLVSSSTTQYGEQTHTMYVSPGPMPQPYSHPGAALHPQPSATPTGQQQQQGQHAGSHPAPSPVQHAQHQAAQALHLGNAPQQQMYSALAPTPPSINPGPNPQSPQANFPSAQQAVYIHAQQVQHGYTPSHMAHMPQAHMQSGMVPSHHTTPSHPPMVLMATQPPGGPQPPLPQSALPPIPVSSTAHFSYMAHPPVQPHHQQQL